MGIPLPSWREQQPQPVLPPLLSEYRAYRRAHNGVAESTLGRDGESPAGPTFTANIGRPSNDRPMVSTDTRGLFATIESTNRRTPRTGLS